MIYYINEDSFGLKKNSIQTILGTMGKIFGAHANLLIWSELGIQVGEGNGNPRQHSCLENPMDGGAWQATVHESDTTERLHFHFSLSCIGEGNGNPLQRSCLENPGDRGAWWAAVYGVTRSRTRLKWLSSSSSSRSLKGHIMAKIFRHLKSLSSF